MQHHQKWKRNGGRVADGNEDESIPAGSQTEHRFTEIGLQERLPGPGRQASIPRPPLRPKKSAAPERGREQNARTAQERPARHASVNDRLHATGLDPHYRLLVRSSLYRLRAVSRWITPRPRRGTPLLAIPRMP